MTRSPHQTNMTRNREMTTDSVCETCQQKIKKNEDTFCCIVCNCKMHLTKNCTSLSDTAINGITKLGKNIALLCNKYVDSNGYERLRKAVCGAEQTSPKQFKKIEEDMDELRKNVQEIKTLFSQTTMKPNDGSTTGRQGPNHTGKSPNLSETTNTIIRLPPKNI